MALTKCSECGGQVSSKATTCPHCGSPVAAAAVEAEHAGAPLTTVQETSKKLKMHIIIASVVFWAGVLWIVVIWEDLTTDVGAPGASIPIIMTLVGLVWYIVTRARIWWYHRKQKDERTGTTAYRSLNLDIPEREEDEEPATEKQLAYIRHLAPGTKPEHGGLEDLGKWQASAIIDQIKEEKEQFESDVERGMSEGEELQGITGRQIFWVALIGLLLLAYFLL